MASSKLRRSSFSSDMIFSTSIPESPRIAAGCWPRIAHPGNPASWQAASCLPGAAPLATSQFNSLNGVGFCSMPGLLAAAGHALAGVHREFRRPDSLQVLYTCFNRRTPGIPPGDTMSASKMHPFSARYPPAFRYLFETPAFRAWAGPSGSVSHPRAPRVSRCHCGFFHKSECL